MEEVGVLGDDADGVVEGLGADLAQVDAVDPDGTGAGVVEAGDEGGDRRLAGPARPDQGDEGAGLDGERHVAQHRTAAPAVAGGGALERGQRDLVGRGVGERDVVDLDAHRARGHRARVGCLGDERLEVEHLEDPLERHERGHDVDADVGDRGERAVEPGEQRREGDERADGQGAGNGHEAADAVDHRRRERRDEGERDEEHRAVDGDASRRCRAPGRRGRHTPRPRRRGARTA